MTGGGDFNGANFTQPRLRVTREISYGQIITTASVVFSILIATATMTAFVTRIDARNDVQDVQLVSLSDRVDRNSNTIDAGLKEVKGLLWTIINRQDKSK